jgi:hypothetical protein
MMEASQTNEPSGSGPIHTGFIKFIDDDPLRTYGGAVYAAEFFIERETIYPPTQGHETHRQSYHITPPYISANRPFELQHLSPGSRIMYDNAKSSGLYDDLRDEAVMAERAYIMSNFAGFLETEVMVLVGNGANFCKTDHDSAFTKMNGRFIYSSETFVCCEVLNLLQ